MTEITAASMFTIGNLQQYSSMEEVDTFYRALADAISLARKGRAADLVHKFDEDYENQLMDKKLALFNMGALMSITLTKQMAGQLRGWIVGPNLLFSARGDHVDEYGNRGVFDAHGLHDNLLKLAEKHLTRGMRRFEDDKFIIWI